LVKANDILDKTPWLKQMKIIQKNLVKANDILYKKPWLKQMLYYTKYLG